ncbi:hypothetical protein HT031_003502 [Scenedesmus sp. PABB004]|nr:hypothetical protein HT031_003502 [Scenedesmus sp. PABB004]
MRRRGAAGVPCLWLLALLAGAAGQQLPRAVSPAPGGGGGSGGNTSSAAAAAGAACAAAPGGGPWGLAAIGEPTSGLPASAPRVLVCLISSGVAARSPYLVHNAWSGCAAEDPLDPGGCALPWGSPADGAGNWKPRGTYAASIIAARPGLDPRVGGVIPGGASLHVVPVNPDSGSIEPGASAPGGRSRLRAYSVCEGRLRGLQAQDYGAPGGAPRWRMVVLADLTSAGPAEPIGSGAMRVGEAEWLAAATGVTAEGRAPDVLLVAPAGEGAAVAFPAAFPQALAVGALTCAGGPARSYSGGAKLGPDLLAPGQGVLVPDVRKEGTAGLRVWEGSAAAAAFAAGGAARLWAAFPGCSVDAVRRALLSSRPAGGGAARLNLGAARAYLAASKC